MTRRQNMARYLIPITIAAAAVLWAVSGSFVTEANSSQQAATEIPLPVATEPVAYVDHIMRPRSYTGTVTAARTSRISFERAGRVTLLSSDEGDRVQARELLGQVDTGQTQSRLQSAKAAIDQANAVLQELIAGPRAEVIASSRANVASLDADVTRLENDFKRSQRLLESKSISREKFDGVRFQRDATIHRRDAAQRQLDELLAGTRSEKLAAQRATLARLKAEHATLELDLEDGQLLAPFAGKIAQRLLDEGTVVTPGMAVYELVDDQNLEAWIGIPPSMATDLVIGEQYTGSVQGNPLKMKLRSLRPNLDELTRTQNAVFEISDTTSLVPGQIIRLEVNQRVDSRGVILPTSALVPGPRGLWNVFVAKPDNEGWYVEQRDVTLIESLGSQSLVSGTLEQGMQVISDGVHRVVAGQRVTVQAATDSRQPEAQR